MKTFMFVLAALCVLSAASANADESFVSISGELRARYETLDGQFRANGSGGDQLLLFRSLVKLETKTTPFRLGVELQDSRTYLGDAGTPLSNSFTNTIDVLQLYADVDPTPNLFGADSNTNVRFGRQTVSILSKRQIERVSYANVIKSYTGAHLTSTRPSGDELHALYVVPVARFPADREALDDNEPDLDKEQWRRRIFGIHYKRANLTSRITGLSGELFLYGLQEDDSSEFQTPDRSYLTAGFRLFRPPLAGQWDLDVEIAHRSGERRNSSDPADTDDLDVDASMLFARVGYTFNTAWQPRIALQYYSTSGDEDPNDDRFDQFERLFGGRRTDLNNTSIHGPLTPANLTALSVRFDVKPTARWDAHLHVSATRLESATDAWIIARLRDPSGQSGRSIGTTIDTRARYWMKRNQLRLEFGASALLFGEFAKNAPDAAEGDRTIFAYSQIEFFF